MKINNAGFQTKGTYTEGQKYVVEWRNSKDGEWLREVFPNAAKAAFFRKGLIGG